jgi:transketolase
MRQSFVSGCEKMISSGNDSVVLLGDIGVFGFQSLINTFPSRVLNLGIMEQAMVGIGAGYASRGIIPTLHSIAPFLVERALEQIKIDFGYQKFPANIVTVGASFDYSGLGCTHHCPADVPTLVNIPGVDLFIPGHATEFSTMFDGNWDSSAINYFRLSENENKENHLLELGEVKCLKHGDNAIVLAVGPILDQVLDGLTNLNVEVHYMNSIPYDSNIRIQTRLRDVPLIIVEPYYSGTLNNKLLDQIADLNLRVTQIGVKRVFSQNYGSYEDHLEFHELNSAHISRRVRQVI